MSLSRELKTKLRLLPDRPGCYLMRDCSGRIIYVGKAASLRNRVRSYFRASARRSAPPRLRSLIASVADLDFIVVRTEEDALATENKLIKDYQPRFNVLLRDDKRFPLLRLDTGTTWPRFQLCRVKRSDNAIYFGPYVSSGAARAAQEFVERKFGLRRCSVPNPDAGTHRHCINDIVRYCSAPCIGRVTRAEYRRRADEAAAFLNGERPALLDELVAAMNAASAALDFEKAAGMRDTLAMLRSAIKRRASVARPRGVPPAGAAAGVAALQAALGLSRPPAFIRAVDISNISGRHAVGAMVAAVNGVCRPELYRRFRITTAATVDDATMTAEVVGRHFRRLLEEQRPMPDLLLVDGGIVQLRAALAALEKLGIREVATAGLAKRFETIVVERRGRALLVSLPHDSPALQLLQRLRDEAHRFALAYHHRLRARLIRESVLDEIPGLGEGRKRLLLRRFGSVGGIASAGAETIAAVPGIGPALANRISAFLKPSS